MLLARVEIPRTKTERGDDEYTSCTHRSGAPPTVNEYLNEGHHGMVVNRAVLGRPQLRSFNARIERQWAAEITARCRDSPGCAVAARKREAR